MPESIRAFFVISFLMACAYILSKYMFARALEQKFVDRLFFAGYCATAILFLSNNMWLFLSALGLLSLYISRRFSYPLSLFVFLILLLPGFRVEVPGFGLINYLIDISSWRVLALTLLLPAALSLMRQPHLPRFGSLMADRVVLAYVLYTAFLAFLHHDTFTGGMRHLFLASLDFALLYYVASRSLSDQVALRHTVVAFVMGALFLSLVGAFEFWKKWLLYSSAQTALGGHIGLFGYLFRGDILRASATTGQPIVLGFVMMVATLLCCYVYNLVPRGHRRTFLWAIMAIGLFSAMSRGPWVGTAVGLFVIALASRKSLVNVIKLFILCFGVGLFMLLLPGGDSLIKYLPWVGDIDRENVEHREILWRQSMVVIADNPWIGSIGFTRLSEFDAIRLGSGFVDVVNSYLWVALSYGLIGLTLYILLLTMSLHVACKMVVKVRNKSPELEAYWVSMLGVFAAVLVTIATVSSISQIELILTLLVGALMQGSVLIKKYE